MKRLPCLSRGFWYCFKLYKTLGFNAKVFSSVKDDPRTVAGIIESNIDDVAIFITSGAVSVGDKDIMHDVLKILGVELLFWRIACKPGKVALFAVYKGKLLCCLSGNPFAAFINFELLVKPALAKLSHRKDLQQKRKKAFLENNFAKSGGGRRFIRAKFNYDLSSVSLPDNHSSGQIYSLLGCNCLVDIPASSTDLSVGSEVEVILL
ncbi:hypothetical protein FACS1894200_03380 [Spirochaetia bacterium]|nr:hypothetical protein FACS1894200_03380 [Spirochaetia bacterium]